MKRAILFVCLIIATLVVSQFLAVFHFFFVTFKAIYDRDSYYLKAFLGYDQGFNAILGPVLNRLFKQPHVLFGDPDKTISGTIGENLRDFPTRAPKSMIIINEWLTKIDPESDNHCVDAIEEECKH